jgi:hypothetical protein
MSFLFGGGKGPPPMRTEVATPPANAAEAETNAANAALLRRRMAYGQFKTMLSGSDLTQAPTTKKTLLGE